MKKRIVGIITAMTMLISVMPQIMVNAADEITISTAAELKAFADNVNNGNTYEGKTVALTADIDLSEICGADINGEEVSWTPVGADNSFNGTFDGNGHTISGLYINSEDMCYAGLFGFCDESSRILNLVVDGSVKTGYPSFEGGWANPPIEIGGIAGASAGKIANCHNKAAITGMGNGAYAAGICGMGLSVDIENCINTGVIVSEYKSEAMVAFGTGYDNDNCYYLEGTSVDGNGAQAKTAAQFASGEVTYLLNGKTSDGDIAWYQNIGEDDFPVLDNTHSAVLFDGEKYYNNEPIQSNKIGTYMSGFNKLENDITTRKITSYAELEAFAEETDAGGLLTAYPSSFFEDKFLFVHYIERGSGISSYKISSVEENENQINIEIIKKYEGVTENIFYWFLFVEADKSLSEKNINVILKDMIASYQIRYYQGRPKHEVDFLPEDNLKLDYTIITSLDELKERWQGEARATKVHGETFFDERSLLIISWQEGQSTRTHKVSDIIFSDNDGIDVTFSSFFNNELGADVMTGYSAEISIPKYYADSKVKINVKNEQTIAYPYAISGLRITNTAGEEIEQVQKNTSFIVEADITKTEERNEKDYLFVAVYDTDGALTSLDYVKAKFSVDGECSFGFSIPPQEKSVGSVKAFVWDSFGTMKPLAETKKLSFFE